jgi:integrase
VRSKAPARKQLLRELTVTKLKPKARAYLVWDSKQDHLAIQVQPSGSKAWKLIYSRHGRPRWLHLGNATAIGLADARAKARKTMVAVDEGRDPAAEKRAERGAGTFAELAKRYVEEHSRKVNKSWKQADTLIERYVLPRWAKLQATTVTRGDVKALMRRIEAPIVANQTLAAVSAIFTWAMREEILPANPCKLVERNETRARERVLGESELPRFWKEFDAAGLEGTALKLILLTGQRPGEIARMRREHIKDDGWWELPGEPVPALGWPGTKNAATHSVWLPVPAREILATLPETGFVLRHRPGHAISQLDRTMRDICKKLNVERATPHDLRRTNGTTITGLGFSRSEMNRIQNHKEGGIADVYDRHKYAEENKRIMEAVAAKIVALVGGKPADAKVVQLPAARR